MAVMLGVIIWLSNRTPNPIGEDMQRERDSIAKADEEKRRQDSIASANAAKAAEEARIAEQKRIKDSIAKAEAKKNSTTQPISGTASGHPYVDLGLPSGTLWATTNVGAANPWDYGDYFAWGETTTKSTYSWSNYTYCRDGDYHKLTKYCSKSDYGYNGYTDSRTTLEKSDDAAYKNWGEGWCMPTQAQFQELKEKCTWTWTTRNGKNGYEVKGPNNKSIFLPAAGRKGSDGKPSYLGSYGYYWSSSLYADSPYSARGLGFNSSYVYADSVDRYYGYSVRPVRCR